MAPFSILNSLQKTNPSEGLAGNPSENSLRLLPSRSDRVGEPPVHRQPLKDTISEGPQTMAILAAISLLNMLDIGVFDQKNADPETKRSVAHGYRASKGLYLARKP